MSGRKQPPSGDRRGLSDAERELWIEITRSLKPLPRPTATATSRAREPQSAVDAGPKSQRPPGVTPAKPLPEATRPALPLAPVSRRTKQKLARGSETIDDRIDLHGMTQVEAHHALVRFLRNAQAHGAKFVLIITGKGRVRVDTTRDAGVLRREVPRWLKLPEFRDYVVSVESAHTRHGGDGALYVRLRRGRER
jgi:DNA-nicking Smr family endonuclease